MHAKLYAFVLHIHIHTVQHAMKIIPIYSLPVVCQKYSLPLDVAMWAVHLSLVVYRYYLSTVLCGYHPTIINVYLDIVHNFDYVHFCIFSPFHPPQSMDWVIWQLSWLCHPIGNLIGASSHWCDSTPLKFIKSFSQFIWACYYRNSVQCIIFSELTIWAYQVLLQLFDWSSEPTIKEPVAVKTR